MYNLSDDERKLRGITDDDLQRTLAEFRAHRFPPKITREWLDGQYEAGKMLPKRVLAHGAHYHGFCRNARIAMWDDGKPLWPDLGKVRHGGKFWYIRQKRGEYFAEPINHPEDDGGFDLFWPTREAT